MTINNPEKFVSTLWDWALLDGCFGKTRIRVTDVDGLVERNGYFLLIETKSPDVAIPAGQRIMFDHIIRDRHWFVLIIWGEANKPVSVQFWGHSVFSADTQKVQEIVSKWFAFADAQGETRAA